MCFGGLSGVLPITIPPRVFPTSRAGFFKPLKSAEIATIHLLAQIYEKLFFFVWNIL